MERVCVYCGSRPGRSGDYAQAARTLGRLLAQRGLGVVYGGGGIGLMRVLADAALEAGGEVIGVIPNFLVNREVAHHGLTQLHVVDGMHARKAMMAELADAFIALPGGLGTLEELFEMLTWGQLNMHAKPCGALNVSGYFSPLAALIEHAVSAGFVKPEHRQLLTLEEDPERLLDRLAQRHRDSH